jgi:hypothetical protein
MAGGKETPRQKMIGMMYLVLTALLALNVSKQVLDAFVAIEENMQKAAIKHMDRGDEVIKTLKGEIVADKSNLEKIKKINYFLGVIDKIDSETGKLIKEIDDIKLVLLDKSGEDVTLTQKPEDSEKILWRQYDTKKPLVPTRLNLAAVQAKDQYDVPMAEMVGDEPMKPDPSKSGMKLWNDYNAYRLKLCSLLGTYNVGGKAWSFNPTNINKFKDNIDLAAQVDKMIEKSKCNKNDDSEALKAVYMELTKPEMLMHKEDGKEAEEWPWMGKTFDHSPLVAAIASLTSMQAEILSARATALAHIKGKVSTGEFSFNSIEGLATGPAFATSGEDIELKIMMAAFDSDNQPVITGGGGSVTVANGQGTMKMRASGGGEMNISGTVKIRKKSGDWAEKPWKHTVKIVQAQGTISIPAYNVLYRAYPNVVECSAAGYPESELNVGQGLTKSVSGKSAKGRKQFVVKTAGQSTQSTLSVIGVNPVTKKRATLLTETYRIKNLPAPVMELVRAQKKFIAKFDDGVPLNGTFSVQNWSFSLMGKSFNGSGSVITGEAATFLNQAKKGTVVNFSGICSGTGMASRRIAGTATL